MADLLMPADLIEARRTPTFDHDSVPNALTGSHRTSAWAEIRVQHGCVRYLDLEGESPRDIRIERGGSAVIKPNVEHRIEPSSDAEFFVQFYRRPEADTAPA